ncbi:uncharacterized protein LOC144433280 [Glandiceps talaboti]
MSREKNQVEKVSCELRMFNIGTYSIDQDNCHQIELCGSHIKLVLRKGRHSVERKCIKIKPADVHMIECCLITMWKLHCILVQTLPEKTREIQQICEMKDRKGFWYDPSSDEECHRRIQLILNTTPEEQSQVQLILEAFRKDFNISRDFLLETITDKDTVNSLMTMIATKSKEAAVYEKEKVRKRRAAPSATLTATSIKRQLEQSSTPVSKHLRSSTVTQAEARPNSPNDIQVASSSVTSSALHKDLVLKNEKLFKEKNQLKVENEKLKDERDKLKDDNKKLQSELKKARQETKTFAQKNSQDAVRLKELEKVDGEKTKLKNKLDKRVLAAEKTTAEVVEKNKNLVKELQELEEKVKSTEQKFEKLQQEKNEIDNKYARMLTSVDHERLKLEKELIQIKKELTESKEQCLKLEQDVRDCSNDKDGVSNTLMGVRAYVLKLLRMVIPPLEEHDIKLNHEVDEMLEEFVEQQPTEMQQS